MLLSRTQFESYADQGFNRVPLAREVLADLDTPLSVYLKLARGPYSYLLESVQGGERWGRYSIIGLPCRSRLEVYGHRVDLICDGELKSRCELDDPLLAIEDLESCFSVPEIDGLPRFTGGLVGYFGYDTVRYIEPKLGDCSKPDPIGAPDIMLLASEELVVFDNLAGKLYVIIHADPGEVKAYETGLARLDELVVRINGPLPSEAVTTQQTLEEADFDSGFGEFRFKAAVERCREYIREGDIMQVVISQRLSVPFKAGPLNLYRALRTLNPSPYMYYMNMGDFHIVGSSPEILVRVEDNEVTVRPIAGTRRRGHSEEEDLALENELLADPKEIAEHIQLLDLGRNDVGRVAKTGTVKPTEHMQIERYSHVMHIVSNVVGELQDGKDALDVLRATFPAGTVSGAPKIRAMEIIDELEPVKRGIYAGAVGYISWNGNMDTAIAIRTAVIKDDTLHIQAGAGIVYDSDPNLEWKETMNKGRAIFRAVNMVTSGLDFGNRA